LRPEIVEHHHLPLRKRRCQEMLDLEASKAKASVAPFTVIDSPMPPSRVIAAIRVVFLARFLGTLP
jgi:hypothetical protein